MDALVADHDAARGQDCLNVAQAQAETVIQSGGVLDDLSGETEAPMWINGRHAGQAATPCHWSHTGQRLASLFKVAA